MFSLSPIWAIVLRYTRLWRRDLNSLLFAFYWPILDVLVWGFMGAWIQSAQTDGFQNYQAVALLGILLWQTASRGANVIGIAFMEELWSANVVNLFSLPIRIREWIMGVILYTMIMMLMTTLFSMVLIYLLYTVSVLQVLKTFLIFFLPMFFCGIWLGFTILQLLVLLGKRGMELAFVIAWFLLPFSGAFYPIDVLPYWLQVVSNVFPMNYVFEGMRGYLMHQQDPTLYLIKGFVLSVLYAAFAIAMFVYCFNRSKQKGLARLVD
ncbi:MAG: ABC transporter permease [Candidatus Babeliales bacterium]